MATQVCPKCDITLKRGSFEIFENCPDCGAQWTVKPGEQARIVRRVKIVGAIFAVLCVIPYLGVVSGLLGAFWGAMAFRLNRRVWGAVVLAVSVIVGLMVQPVLAYRHLRDLSEQFCHYELTVMHRSIEGFKAKNNRYPETLDELTKAKFEVPKQCLSGQGYFYLPPYGWRMSTISSTAPAATRAGFPAKGDAREVEAAAGRMPASWGNKPPASLEKVFKAASMPATFPAEAVATPASADLANLLVVAELTETHQKRRMCLMADGSVRSLSPSEFEALVSQEQNAVFGRYLQGAWRLTTQRAKKVAVPSE